MKRITILMLLALVSTALLSSCNTIKGAGKDMQKVGEKIEDVAK